MFRTLRLKRLSGETEEELKEIFEGISGNNTVESVCSIYDINDYKQREKTIEELRMKIRLAKESGKNPNALVTKKRTLEDENKITRCNLMHEPTHY